MIYTLRAPKGENRRQWLLYRAGGLAAFIFIAGLVIIWANSTEQGTIINPPQSNQQQSKKFSDKYVSFTYPAEYNLQRLNGGLPDLESYALTADTTYTKRIAVYIATNNLAANTDFTSRSTRPAVYRQSTANVAGSSATVFDKQDGTEQSIFVPHGHIVLELAFSIESSNATSQLDREAQSIVDSVVWK